MSAVPVHVILLAGGSGSRMNAGVNKVLLELGGETVLGRSAAAFAGFADHMVVVCRQEDRSAIEQALSGRQLPFPLVFTTGGATRQESVARGLDLLRDDPEDIVLVHDAARCFVDGDIISGVLRSVSEFGSGVPAIPVTDTVKRCDAESWTSETLPRDQLRAVQTPQGFYVKDLLSALEKAERDNFIGTDDASLLEHAGSRVHLTLGSRRNVKLTTQEDLLMAENLLRETEPPLFRVGQGYDVHRLVSDQALILCGVEIPFELGLLGHSDADVALHALMDAMLGAAGLGDIGKHFPDTDPAYRGISSMKLLDTVVRLLADHGAAVTNADITIVAQKPKIAPYIQAMKENVARALALPESRVNVKATTTERLGFEGRMEGISAQAVCMIRQ